MTATFDKGVLEVTVPKPEQQAPRKVTITVGGASTGEPQAIESSEEASAPEASAPEASPRPREAPRAAASAHVVSAEPPAGPNRRTVGSGLTGAQRMMPVWPREWRPGWGQTHRPWGPEPTGIVARRWPVRVSMA